MNKRDREDVMMQATETVRGVMDEVNREQLDTDVKRQMGALWSALPADFKAQMAADHPDIAKEMDKLYGRAQKQGNPWGVRKDR